MTNLKNEDKVTVGGQIGVVEGILTEGYWASRGQPVVISFENPDAGKAIVGSLKEPLRILSYFAPWELQLI